MQLIIYTAAEAEYWSNKIQQTNTMSVVGIKIHIRIVLIKKILGHPLKWGQNKQLQIIKRSRLYQAEHDPSTGGAEWMDNPIH